MDRSAVFIDLAVFEHNGLFADGAENPIAGLVFRCFLGYFERNLFKVELWFSHNRPWGLEEEVSRMGVVRVISLVKALCGRLRKVSVENWDPILRLV